jgi:DNA ligase-1
MSQITKPMLAGKCSSPARLTFPVLATPKLDGIRCLIINGKAVSRAFKPIPNDYIRNTIETCINSYQFDGEIMIEGRSFNDLSGDVRRKDGRPTNFYYAVFDYITNMRGISQPYNERMEELASLQNLPPFVRKILPVFIKNEIELATYERDQLALGYEGVMVRGVYSPYKCGRSSENEGYLLKIKQFEDSEAVIVGYEEQMHNDNVATRDAFGRTERSTNQENMRPAGVLGKLICQYRRKPEKLDKPGELVEFGIGTGFDAKTRAELWVKRDKLKNKIVKFKHQPSGADEKPRFPVFLGFRDEWDM